VLFELKSDSYELAVRNAEVNKCRASSSDENITAESLICRGSHVFTGHITQSKFLLAIHFYTNGAFPHGFSFSAVAY
jgi:hypothetical protein